MLKKQYRYFFISLFLILIACAPKPKIAPPPVYEKADLTLEELISKAGNAIHVIKAITDVRIEKNNEFFDSVNALILVKKPELIHARIYKFGILVKDFVIKGSELYMLSGKGGEDLNRFGREFHNAVFWWDNIENGSLYKKDSEYIIIAENKEVHLDRATLMPLRQNLVTADKTIYITYHDPVQGEKGYWHPSLMDIYFGEYRFSVRLKKLLLNPSLGEFDFRIPVTD